MLSHGGIWFFLFIFKMLFFSDQKLTFKHWQMTWTTMWLKYQATLSSWPMIDVHAIYYFFIKGLIVHQEINGHTHNTTIHAQLSVQSVLREKKRRLILLILLVYSWYGISVVSFTVFCMCIYLLFLPFIIYFILCPGVTKALWSSLQDPNLSFMVEWMIIRTTS